MNKTQFPQYYLSKDKDPEPCKTGNDEEGEMEGGG